MEPSTPCKFGSSANGSQGGGFANAVQRALFCVRLGTSRSHKGSSSDVLRGRAPSDFSQSSDSTRVAFGVRSDFFGSCSPHPTSNGSRSQPSSVNGSPPSSNNSSLIALDMELLCRWRFVCPRQSAWSAWSSRRKTIKVFRDIARAKVDAHRPLCVEVKVAEKVESVPCQDVGTAIAGLRALTSMKSTRLSRSVDCPARSRSEPGTMHPPFQSSYQVPEHPSGAHTVACTSALDVIGEREQLDRTSALANDAANFHGVTVQALRCREPDELCCSSSGEPEPIAIAPQVVGEELDSIVPGIDAWLTIQHSPQQVCEEASKLVLPDASCESFGSTSLSFREHEREEAASASASEALAHAAPSVEDAEIAAEETIEHCPQRDSEAIKDQAGLGSASEGVAHAPSVEDAKIDIEETIEHCPQRDSEAIKDWASFGSASDGVANAPSFGDAKIDVEETIEHSPRRSFEEAIKDQASFCSASDGVAHAASVEDGEIDVEETIEHSPQRDSEDSQDRPPSFVQLLQVSGGVTKQLKAFKEKDRSPQLPQFGPSPQESSRSFKILQERGGVRKALNLYKEKDPSPQSPQGGPPSFFKVLQDRGGVRKALNVYEEQDAPRQKPSLRELPLFGKQRMSSNEPGTSTP